MGSGGSWMREIGVRRGNGMCGSTSTWINPIHCWVIVDRLLERKRDQISGTLTGRAVLMISIQVEAPRTASSNDLNVHKCKQLDEEDDGVLELSAFGVTASNFYANNQASPSVMYAPKKTSSSPELFISARHSVRLPDHSGVFMKLLLRVRFNEVWFSGIASLYENAYGRMSLSYYWGMASITSISTPDEDMFLILFPGLAVDRLEHVLAKIFWKVVDLTIWPAWNHPMHDSVQLKVTPSTGTLMLVLQNFSFCIQGIRGTFASTHGTSKNDVVFKFPTFEDQWNEPSSKPTLLICRGACTTLVNRASYRRVRLPTKTYVDPEAFIPSKHDTVLLIDQ
ncbi:uncharacterized protein BT62DRAFT_1013391 [Guyanagaster necrorhizus]|uniref:Uncharacterized protein n=1 Tax=Guyanagaster necrorhizus TaxID=856835 RepID=A0A9P8AL46_9AGAR|nr:uncharacterized protein BT62DRAFT_1013391 [Guyanagaster necrorhizus MCA 3950]KAG7439848.1 hypothetical protein BT62DRAFT_1013391 [Guyanagaster necrorhizus MCA 3950]